MLPFIFYACLLYLCCVHFLTTFWGNKILRVKNIGLHKWMQGFVLRFGCKVWLSLDAYMSNGEQENNLYIKPFSYQYRGRYLLLVDGKTFVTSMPFYACRFTLSVLSRSPLALPIYTFTIFALYLLSLNNCIH